MHTARGTRRWSVRDYDSSYCTGDLGKNLCMLDSQILRKGKGFESVQSTYKQVNVWYYLGKLHSEGMRQSE